MSIVQKEEGLFSRWAAKRENFVKDGVVCENEYLKSNPKVLFVLKEVNKYQGDLRKVIREGERTQTWTDITRWVRGIRELKEDILWDELKDISTNDRKNELESIAVMNLKKTSGGRVTNEKELKTIALADRDFIRTQISLYDADIMICGGSITAYLVREILDIDPSEYNETTRGVIYHKNNHGRIIVDYHHPESRVTDNLLHYGLMDALREITKTG